MSTINQNTSKFWHELAKPYLNFTRRDLLAATSKSPSAATSQSSASSTQSGKKHLWQQSLKQSATKSPQTAHNEWAIRSGYNLKAAQNWRKFAEALQFLTEDQKSGEYLGLLSEVLELCEKYECHPVQFAMWCEANQEGKITHDSVKAFYIAVGADMEPEEEFDLDEDEDDKYDHLEEGAKQRKRKLSPIDEE